EAALSTAWRRLVPEEDGAALDLMVKGRAVHIPRAAMGVARLSFHELCEMPLGAEDYLKIAHAFHTIVLDRIPVMGPEKRNEAKRFITLIDALYDNAVKLIASAEAEPVGLYLGQEGYEALEFQRTVSRLIEMRSHSYLALPHGRRDSTASGSTEGIVET
ncbi:MAG TPA: AFG1/ZapE family ATPase, partial [Xanthobacteraceae bacterium]|nr:AFG1/ZapE family ATPase [Xanthobacteraceae bacterium]